jgi:hypothetical protein
MRVLWKERKSEKVYCGRFGPSTTCDRIDFQKPSSPFRLHFIQLLLKE